MIAEVEQAAREKQNLSVEGSSKPSHHDPTPELIFPPEATPDKIPISKQIIPIASQRSFETKQFPKSKS